MQQTIAGATSTQALLRFDDNGNLRKLCEGTSVSGTANDCSSSQTTSLSWDGLDQLVGLAKAGTQALSEAYAYDDAGRRLRKSSGANSSHYVYNGDDIAAEWSGGNALNGTPSAVYAHGPGVDEPLMRLTGASGSLDATSAYYVQDGLGSVVALFSAGTAANQTPLAGNTLSTTGDYSAASYPPAHLKDGITVGSDTSGWVAVVANGAAATLSLGSATALERIELMAVSNYKPASFVVEVQQSSGGAWQQVASGTGDDFVAWTDGSSVRAVKSFPVTVASAIRVRFTGAVNSGFVWLTEWQVWSAGGSAVTQGFDAWGQVLQASGSIPTYGYTGREPDASGLMFYRARYYHPGLGQFISRDPLGLAAGCWRSHRTDPARSRNTDPLLEATPRCLRQ